MDGCISSGHLELSLTHDDMDLLVDDAGWHVLGLLDRLAYQHLASENWSKGTMCMMKIFQRSSGFGINNDNV